MNNPPLLRTLASDPLLRNVKLIAEAWDAGGMYQVGSFPASGRWAEWNGRYRDSLRSFLKGDCWSSWDAAWSISGSGDLTVCTRIHRGAITQAIIPVSTSDLPRRLYSV